MLSNLVVYIQSSLFVNYSFILYILQFCSLNVFTVFQPQLPELFCKNYSFFFYSVLLDSFKKGGKKSSSLYLLFLKRTRHVRMDSESIKTADIFFWGHFNVINRLAKNMGAFRKNKVSTTLKWAFLVLRIHLLEMSFGNYCERFTWDIISLQTQLRLKACL